MNSAINSLGTASPAGSQNNKNLHVQGAPPTSFGQSPHVSSQSLGNMHTNTNIAHSHPNQQNHYPMSAPSSTGHYMNQNLGQIPVSNHPVANPSSTAAGQGFNSQKNVTAYLGGYQANIQPHQENANSATPLTQGLTSLLTPSNSNPSAISGNSEQCSETSQTNGTSEVKSPQKSENLSSNDKTVQPAPVPELSDVKSKSPMSSLTTNQQSQSNILKVSDEEATSTPSNEKASPSNSTDTRVSENLSAPLNANSVAQIENNELKKHQSSTDEPELKTLDQEENCVKPIVNRQNDSTEHNEEKSENNSTPAKIETNSNDEEHSETDEKVSSKDESTVKPTTENTTKTPPRKTKPHTSKSEEFLKMTKESKSISQKTPSTGKLKRQRFRTQPYQSPLPEVELISKISSLTPKKPKSDDEKLVVFYKNEFLAVRNAEGSFYLCQTVQNIYKSTSKIKIRWLSQDKNDKTGEIYTPDFYDLTDFDCILTNLSLQRIDKGKFRLPPSEKDRTQSILNRSLAVEKGEVTSPSLTEEHPDGLDLSLYRDEDQLKKGTRKRKAGRKPSGKSDKKVTTKKIPEAPKVRKTVSGTKASEKNVAAKKAQSSKQAVSQTESKKSSTAVNRPLTGTKRKAEAKPNPAVDQKKAKVLAKIGKTSSISVAKTLPSSAKNSKPGNKSSSKKAPKSKTTANSTVKTTTRNVRRTRK